MVFDKCLRRRCDKMEKLVSVIMPVHNAKSYIEEAINSILNQTYGKFELIIIDDCSTDDTMSIVHGINDSRIRILKNESNKGVSYSRNRGLEESQGEYIAIMDDDDVSMPQRFAKQVQYLEEHKEIDIVGGRIQLIDEKGNEIGYTSGAFYNPQFIKAMFLFRNLFCNSEVMFRKSVIGGVRYEDGCLGMEDFKFWIQLSKYAPMTMLNEIFLKHRVHDSSLTVRMKEEKYLERKRIFAEMQDFSWKLSGIRIAEKETYILHKYIVEDRECSCQNFTELKEFYIALVAFLDASKHLDFYEEIKSVCKKELLTQISRLPDLWNLV